MKWELACSKDDPYKLEWFINIGGSARLTHATDPKLVPKDPVDSWIDPTTHRPMIVHGGLVVPWYFVALALIGGAVIWRADPDIKGRRSTKARWNLPHSAPGN